MKNRLQFNRHFPIFSGATEIINGEEVWKSGREQANEWLDKQIKRTDFIPLIGEPIVLRYLDKEGKKQLILAVGKATGNTIAQTTQREYHIIDTAELKEGVADATEIADKAYELASAVTKDVANYRIILQNMIGNDGVELEDGSYFETDDPSGCGLYKVYPGTNFISGATSLAKADYILDRELGKANENIADLADAIDEANGRIDDLSGATVALSGVVGDFSANTVAELDKLNDDLVELSGVTEVFSGATDQLFSNIKVAAGLEPDGTYEHDHNANFIDDAKSLFEADQILDTTLNDLSANTMAVVAELSAATEGITDEIEAKVVELSGAVASNEDAIDALSAGTIQLSADTEAAVNALDDKVSELSAGTIADINNLSANTVAADNALSDRIGVLEMKRIEGEPAIDVAVSGNVTTVSLNISDDDKVLSQDYYGLKANLTLRYSSADTKIYLVGKDDAILGEIETNDFIKDGMIQAVTLITPTQEWIDEHPEYNYANLHVGTPYLWITFNVDSPNVPKDVFIELLSLVDVYTVDPDSRNYMEINDYVISLNVNEDGGLAGYDYAKEISAVTTNIIKAAGLNQGEEGGYVHHDTTAIICSANSLDEADVLLDQAIVGVSGMVITLSANVVNYIDEKTEGYDEQIDELGDKLVELSGVTRDLSGITHDFSAATHAKIEELSANTINPAEFYEYVDEKVGEVSGDIAELSAVTEDFSGATYAQIMELSARTIEPFDPTEIYEAIGEVSGRCDDIEADVAQNTEDIETLSGLVGTLSAATDGILNEVNDQISELSGSMATVSGLTDGVLTLQINGTEQGKYSPSADTTINLEVITEVTGADVLLTGYEVATTAADIEATDNVNEAFGKIQKQANDLAGDIDVISGIVATIEEVSISGVSALSAAVVSNENKIADLSGTTEAISGYAHDEIAALSGVVEDFSGATDGKITALSAGTIQLSADTKAAIDALETSVGGSIDGLNDKIDELSGGTIQDIEALDVKVGTLSGDTYNTIQELSGAVRNNETNIEALSGDVETNATNINAISVDLSELSAACMTMSADVTANRTDIDTLSGSLIDDELIIAAAFNDVNDRIIELSARTVDLSDFYTKEETYSKEEIDQKIASGGTFDPTQYYTTANTYNKTEVDNLIDAITLIESANTSFSAKTSESAVTSLSASTSLSAETSNSAITSLSAITSENAISSVSAVTSLSAQTSLSALTAGKLNHNVTINLSGDCDGSVTTDFAGNSVNIGTYKTFSTANTLANLTMNDFLVVVNAGADDSLTFANTGLPELPANGTKEVHIIIKNTGTTGITIDIAVGDTRVVYVGEDSINLNPGSSGEITVFVTYDGTDYVFYVINKAIVMNFDVNGDITQVNN